MLSEWLLDYLSVGQLSELFRSKPHGLYKALLLLQVFKDFPYLSHDLSVNVQLKWVLGVQRMLVRLSEVAVRECEVYSEREIKF